MKQYLRVHKKQSYFLVFTMTFCILSLVVFGPFIVAGKSFIWTIANEDGLVQHCNALMYYGSFLRELLYNIFIKHEFILPMYDLSIAFGGDIISTFHYYCIGDPLALLSVFVPKEYTEYLFGFIVILRFYLSGIAFSLLCFHKKKNMRATFIGAFIYMFSGFAMYALRHPYFINSFIYLPIVIIGVDRVLHKGNPLLFCLSITVCLASNFYFFYMITILIFIYALFEYWNIHQKIQIKQLLNSFFRCLWYYILGVMIACIIFVPVFLLFIQTARAADRPFIPTFYTLDYYLKLIGGFSSMNMNGYWSIISLAAPSFIGIICLFFGGKKKRFLRVAFILLTILLCIPYVGSVMNGFSYISNRWSFGYILLACYIFVDMYPDLYQIFQKYRYFIIGIFVAYCILLYEYEPLKNIESLVSLTIIFICMIYLLVFYKKINSFFVIGSLTIVSISANSYFLFARSQQSYVSEFEKSGYFYDIMVNGQQTLVPSLDQEFSRYDMTKDKNYHHNTSLNTNRSTISYYYSLCPGNVSKFLFDMENLNTLSSQFSGVNERSYLEALFSTKYYVASRGGKNRIPYGFKKNNELSKPSSNYDIYENNMALPLGYTYSSTIDEETYSSYTSLQKQEALMQSAVVHDNQLSNENHPQFHINNIPYQLSSNPNIIYKDNKFYVKKKNQSIKLTFKGEENSETYLRFGGLEYKQNDDSKTSRDLTSEGYSLFDASINHPLPRISRIRVSSSNQQRNTISIKSKYYMYYNGINDFLCNVGYDQNAKKSIVLTFDQAGIYQFDSLDVYTQSMSPYNGYVNNLTQDILENVDISQNMISGNIDVSSKKLLVFSIPYSIGWSVYVDGKKVQTHEANEMFLSTYIDPGNHEIKLEYQTPGLILGSCISLIGFVSLYFSMRKRKKYNELL